MQQQQLRTSIIIVVVVVKKHVLRFVPPRNIMKPVKDRKAHADEKCKTPLLQDHTRTREQYSLTNPYLCKEEDNHQ